MIRCVIYLVVIEPLQTIAPQGSHNLAVNDLPKWIYTWQRTNNLIVELAYIRTKNNLSDAPSRIIDIDDENCITPSFNTTIETDFNMMSLIFIHNPKKLITTNEQCWGRLEKHSLNNTKSSIDQFKITTLPLDH